MQDMIELREEEAYWLRLVKRAEADGLPYREDIGLGACLASVRREIAEREASCDCGEHAR